ncbi:MAG: hypothetical protein MJ197_10085 [Bacteroidales bacterium]|nr:hypothetical protein [Bacteroidales bacterium]
MGTDETLKALYDISNRQWKFIKEFLNKNVLSDEVGAELYARITAEVKATPDELKDYATDIFNRTTQELGKVAKHERKK